MTADAIRAVVLKILHRIAPEADLNSIRFDENWRQQLDIDSIDFLNFVVTLNKELHVEIPETDYGCLATLQGCIKYLSEKQSV